jgi:uncharacterized protein
MTECFFFKNYDYKLFGALHAPNDMHSEKSIGIVFCSPFAEEKFWSQRIYTNLANHLSQQGLSVLRFDYFGHGDSEGNFEDADIQRRLQDIRCAVNLLQDRTGVQTVGLFGLRFGATLAALYAEKEPGVDFLILWEPILQGEKYIKQCLRSNITYQTTTYKKIVYTRDKMIEDLTADKPVNIDGYLLTGKFFKQIIKVDLSEININFANPVQIAHLTKNSKKDNAPDFIKLYEAYNQNNSLTDFQIVESELFWGNTKNYYQKNDELFILSSIWLENILV